MFKSYSVKWTYDNGNTFGEDIKKKRQRNEKNNKQTKRWFEFLFWLGSIFSFTSQGWDSNIISFDFMFKLEWKSVQNGAFVDGLANANNAVSNVYMSVAIIFS